MHALSFLLAGCCCLGWTALTPGDWPQWRGPARDGISAETGLLKKFSGGGPRLLWQWRATGIGYSAPVVAGDLLVVLGAEGDQDQGYKEFVLALDAKTGQQRWQTQIGTYADRAFMGGWGHGPRGSASIDAGQVFALGGRSDFACLDAQTGEIRWKKNLLDDLGGKLMSGWGYSESPLVDGDRVVCTPGGAQGSLAAFDRKTGQVLWRSEGLTDEATYSSIVPATIHGVKQYVQLLRRGVAGVEAATGKVLWKIDVVSSGGVAMVPTPLVDKDLVYVTSSYRAGCALVRVKKNGNTFTAEKVYENKNVENHHGGVVLVGGHVYGWSGNSTGRGRWFCQNLLSGKVVWTEERKLPSGSLTVADGCLWCYSQEDGTLAVIKATTSGWQEVSRFKIPEETKIPRGSGKIWTHPVIANGRLYLRDQDLLFCFSLKG